MNLARIAFAAAIFCLSLGAAAQSARTLGELKAEAQARADRNAYPLIGLQPDDVREALGLLKTLDAEEWAASWMQVGDRYMAKGDDDAAWKYYSFARWPYP